VRGIAVLQMCQHIMSHRILFWKFIYFCHF